MVDFQQLASKDWRRLRDIRLKALTESPDFFLSTVEKEQKYRQKQWQDEFDRGEWTVGVLGGSDVCLLGVTKIALPVASEEDQVLGYEYNLEYMWVDPDYRGKSLALKLVTHVLDRLHQAELRQLYLWVLDGNDPAVSLYESLHFRFTGLSQPLEDRPNRREDQMCLELSQEILAKVHRRTSEVVPIGV